MTVAPSLEKEAAIAARDLDVALYESAAAGGATAAELGVLGQALGLFDEAAANSALKSALITLKIQELAQAYIDGDMAVWEMRQELGDFITGLDNVLEPADDAGEAIGEMTEEAETWINGSPYEAIFDAATEDALSDIEDIGEAARASAGHYNIHYAVTTTGTLPSDIVTQGGTPLAQHGLDFMVPGSYLGDTFGPIFAHGGERVRIETREQQEQGSAEGGIAFNFFGAVSGAEEMKNAINEALLEAGIDADRIYRTR